MGNKAEASTITTCNPHGFEIGDTAIVYAPNYGVFELFWYWLIRKPIKRDEKFIVTSVDSMTSVEEVHS